MGTSRINLVGYREALDNYFSQKYHSRLNPTKPTQEIPPLFEEIIDFLEHKGNQKRISISNYLLSFSSEAKETFAEQVLQVFNYQKSKGRVWAITQASKNEDDPRYSCFIQQPQIARASSSEQDDYIWSAMLWNEEKDRVKLNIAFDNDRKITGVDFFYYDECSIPSNRRDYLFEQGKSRVAERLQKYRTKHGNKIGRNAMCPCGSGKKC